MKLARWESRGGAHFVGLRKHTGHDDSTSYYSYTGNGCGGILGTVATDEEAVAILQKKVDSGYFLPDSAKVPMKRVL